nr:acyltransferase [Hymenobacter citatus]
MDSVRGIAAFAVMIYHFIGWRWADTLDFKVSAMLFNGSDAVSLFFVLSGLVLSWKYFHPDNSLVIDGAHYKNYVINRVIRLYVPLLAALAGYYLYYHRHDPLKQLVLEFVLNKYHWIEEALLIRGKHDMYVPAWTLEVEMAASLCIPFLVLLLRYNRQLFGAFVIMLLVLGSTVILWELFHFCLGMWIAYYFHRIKSYDLRNSPLYPYRFVLCLLVFALFSMRHIIRIFPLSDSVTSFMSLIRIDIFHFTGLASALILAYIINSPKLQRFLISYPLLFLGRISYSVYLLHWFFVVYVMDHWDKLAAYFSTPEQSFSVLLLAVVLSTLATATLFNILVEQPAIRLGKRVANRFAPAIVLQPTS